MPQESSILEFYYLYKNPGSSHEVSVCHFVLNLCLFDLGFYGSLKSRQADQFCPHVSWAGLIV